MTPRAALFPLAALALAGCISSARPPAGPLPPPKLRAYRSGALDHIGRFRVLVPPFQHNDRAAAQAVTEAFALELEKLQLFEVLGPESREANSLERLGLWNGDGLDVHTLTVLRRRLRVDGVAVGQILHYRPYDPPVLSLRVHMVATATGVALWGAAGAFDAREAGVQARMRRFHACELDDPPRGLGWRLLLTSPRYFTQYVSAELVATLRPAPRPAVAMRTAHRPSDDPNGR